MPEVFLDGERVDFQGAAPESARAVCEAVASHLADAGRTLLEARVDGEAFAWDLIEESRQYERLQIKSGTFSEQLAVLCSEWIPRCRSHSAQAEDLSCGVLVSRWTDARERALSLLESQRGLLEALELARAFGEQAAEEWLPAFAERFSDLLGSIDAVADSIQASDVVALSDSLSLRHARAWLALAEGLEKSLLPALDGGSKG